MPLNITIQRSNSQINIFSQKCFRLPIIEIDSDVAVMAENYQDQLLV